MRSGASAAEFDRARGRVGDDPSTAGRSPVRDKADSHSLVHVWDYEFSSRDSLLREARTWQTRPRGPVPSILRDVHRGPRKRASKTVQKT